MPWSTGEREHDPRERDDTPLERRKRLARGLAGSVGGDPEPGRNPSDTPLEERKRRGRDPWGSGLGDTEPGRNTSDTPTTLMPGASGGGSLGPQQPGYGAQASEAAGDDEERSTATETEGKGPSSAGTVEKDQVTFDDAGNEHHEYVVSNGDGTYTALSWGEDENGPYANVDTRDTVDRRPLEPREPASEGPASAVASSQPRDRELPSQGEVGEIRGVVTKSSTDTPSASSGPSGNAPRNIKKVLSPGDEPPGLATDKGIVKQPSPTPSLLEKLGIGETPPKPPGPDIPGGYAPPGVGPDRPGTVKGGVTVPLDVTDVIDDLSKWSPPSKVALPDVVKLIEKVGSSIAEPFGFMSKFIDWLNRKFAPPPQPVDEDGEPIPVAPPDESPPPTAPSQPTLDTPLPAPAETPVYVQPWAAAEDVLDTIDVGLRALGLEPRLDPALKMRRLGAGVPTDVPEPTGPRR